MSSKGSVMLAAGAPSRAACDAAVYHHSLALTATGPRLVLGQNATLCFLMCRTVGSSVLRSERFLQRDTAVASARTTTAARMATEPMGTLQQSTGHSSSMESVDP